MQSGEPVKPKHIQYIKDMKEQMCSVALDFNQELSSYEDELSFEERQYELPDNSIIEVNKKKRIRAAEVLFDPKHKIKPILGNSTYDEFRDDCLRGGIAKMAFESIRQCDTDLKVSLYSNIVLAGGSTMMRGFYERFDTEMRDFVAAAQDD
jgi:actin-related protein